MIRFGYAAQNLTIPATTNRTLRLASLADADKVHALVEENLAGLRAIVEWNAAHGIGLFRIGQSLIPFASHPAFPYDWRTEHADELRAAGDLAHSLGVRLSMHPGQYIQPGSPTPKVVENSLAELRYVTELFDLIGASDAVVVLHVGGAYGDRPFAAARFASALEGEPSLLSYLALENDERIWTVEEVVETAERLAVPAIADTLHHALNPGRLSFAEALDLALPTWRALRPKVHLSSQDPEKQAGAHAFGILPADWDALHDAIAGREVDVMVEAKGKEKAVLALGEVGPGAGETNP